MEEGAQEERTEIPIPQELKVGEQHVPFNDDKAGREEIDVEGQVDKIDAEGDGGDVNEVEREEGSDTKADGVAAEPALAAAEEGFGGGTEQKERRGSTFGPKKKLNFADFLEYQRKAKDAQLKLNETMNMDICSKSTKLEDLDSAFVLARKEIYDQIVKPFPTIYGKGVSKKERQELGLMHHAYLAYGEIDFESLAIALEKIKTMYGLPDVGTSGEEGILQEPGGTFYDIGSGTGKSVVAAALLHPFDYVGGIEILEGLFSASEELRDIFYDQGERLLDEEEEMPEMEFVHGDATDMLVKDWGDADVVFVNSTTFGQDLMKKIADAAATLRMGAFVITLTNRLPSAYFRVLEYQMYDMSWGAATVYIQQKIIDEDDFDGEGDEAGEPDEEDPDL